MSKTIRTLGLCVLMVVAHMGHGAGQIGADPYASIRFRSVDVSGAGLTLSIGALNNRGQIAAYGYESDSDGTMVQCWLFDGSGWSSFGLGGTDCYAADVNDDGVVVGYAQVASGYYHPFVYANGVAIDLGTLGAASAYALAVNGSGTAVGYLLYDTGLTHAFVYENGVMRDLDPQCASSIASDINDAGQVAGYRSCNGGPNEAFRYQNDAFETIILPSSAATFGSFINASGDVAGFFYPADGDVRAFVFTDGTAHDLGTLPDGGGIYPLAFSDSGVLVGYSWAGGDFISAFASADGALVDLGSLDPSNPSSQANAVKTGRIVGSTMIGGRRTGFFSTGVGMRDLNALLTADSVGPIYDAIRINDAGQIAATAIVGGQLHIALLTPAVAIPASQLTVTAPPSTYGTSAQLTATLASNGIPLAQKTLAFSIDGHAIGAVTTDVNGVATTAAAQSLPAGPHSVHASFAGDDQYAASESDAILSIAKASPVMTIAGGQFNYDGLPHAAIAFATGAIGESLGPVIVTYNGSPVAPVNPGTFAALASYFGDGNYQPGSASAVIKINGVPSALCRNVTVVGAADSTAAASVDAGSFDPEGDAFTLLQVPAGPFLVGQTRVTLTATDVYGASSSCAATVTVLRYGLRAAYGFEEAAGAGTALDTTPFHNNGVLKGPVRTAGRFGQGMRFDGVDDIIDIADSNSLDMTVGLTLMAWVKPDNPRGWRNIVMKERPGGLAYALYSNNSSTDVGQAVGYADYAGVDREVTAVDCGVAGKWMHVAMTFGGGKMRMYVNGVLQSTVWTFGNLPVSDRPLRLGGNTVWPGEFFSGVMDEVRIYDRPLSETELRDDMKAPVVFGSASRPTSPTGLVAAYSFDDGTARDVSGHGHDGAVKGAVAAPGRRGQALSFDGVDDLVEIADRDDLHLASNMTIEAWVYPTALGTMWRTAVLKSGASGLSYALYANDDGGRPAAYARLDGDDMDARQPATLPLNAWTHVVATYDKAAGQLALWVNGVSAGRLSVPGDIDSSNGALFIGGNTVWGEYFAGSIDGVRLYNRALDIVEIQTNMITPP